MQCSVIKELDKDFHKMQLGQGGECKACKRGNRRMNLKSQQPLIGMIFTNADPRYAGRLDDKQGGDTIVTMEQVKEAIALNAELAEMMMIAFMTPNSNLVPLLEGLS